MIGTRGRDINMISQRGLAVRDGVEQVPVVVAQGITVMMDFTSVPHVGFLIKRNVALSAT